VVRIVMSGAEPAGLEKSGILNRLLSTSQNELELICVTCTCPVVVLFQISDYPGGVAVISGGFSRLVCSFTDDSSHN